MFSYLWYSIAINCTISNNAKLSRNISAIGSRENTSVVDRVPLGYIFGIFMEIESPIVWRKKVATSQSALQKKKANVTYMEENSKTAWRQNFTVPEHIDKTTYCTKSFLHTDKLTRLTLFRSSLRSLAIFSCCSLFSLRGSRYFFCNSLQKSISSCKWWNSTCILCVCTMHLTYMQQPRAGPVSTAKKKKKKHVSPLTVIQM